MTYAPIKGKCHACGHDNDKFLIPSSASPKETTIRAQLDVAVGALEKLTGMQHADEALATIKQLG